MTSQLDTASMRHMTHEKMKSHTVQGKAEIKSPVQQKPNSTEAELFLLVPEEFSAQLHLLRIVYSGLCGFVLATRDATIMTAARDLQWHMSFEQTFWTGFSSVLPSLGCQYFSGFLSLQNHETPLWQLICGLPGSTRKCKGNESWFGCNCIVLICSI